MIDTNDSVVNTIINLGTVAGAAGTVVFGFFKLISSQISRLSEKMDEGNKELMKQLNYHEQHDDKRFSDIFNELWTIKVRNAVKDGNIPRYDPKGLNPAPSRE